MVVIAFSGVEMLNAHAQPRPSMKQFVFSRLEKDPSITVDSAFKDFDITKLDLETQLKFKEAMLKLDAEP